MLRRERNRLEPGSAAVPQLPDLVQRQVRISLNFGVRFSILNETSGNFAYCLARSSLTFLQSFEFAFPLAFPTYDIPNIYVMVHDSIVLVVYNSLFNFHDCLHCNGSIVVIEIIDHFRDDLIAVIGRQCFTQPAVHPRHRLVLSDWAFPAGNSILINGASTPTIPTGAGISSYLCVVAQHRFLTHLPV